MQHSALEVGKTPVFNLHDTSVILSNEIKCSLTLPQSRFDAELADAILLFFLLSLSFSPAWITWKMTRRRRRKKNHSSFHVNGVARPFNNDVICGKALWEQSLFMTYHRYTTHFCCSPLLCQYVVSLGSIFAIWENSLNKKLTANDVIINKVYRPYM